MTLAEKGKKKNNLVRSSELEKNILKELQSGNRKNKK